MIRVNLLPQKRRAEKAEGSQLWLVALLVLFLAEVVGLFMFQGYKNAQLQHQKQTNAELQTQINQAKATVRNHDRVKKKLAQLRARENAIDDLEKARTGPTAMMLELARILTPGQGPTVSPDRLAQLRQDNPQAMYNANWDARRLWLTKFVERNRKVHLEGEARNGRDVSELARRMNLSSYFQDVQLLPGQTEKDAKSGLSLVHFQLEAKVIY